MKRWPNLFIVGAPKAGTTSLYEYLREVPDIFLPIHKEPRFFAPTAKDEIKPNPSIKDKEEYLKLFEQVNNERFYGEGSTIYLSDPDAPKLIHEVSPSARIIISLRDPVERAFSAYLMVLRQGYLKEDFHNEIQKELKKEVDNTKSRIRLEAGLYFNSVKRYTEIFGEKNVKILIFEEMIMDTKRSVQDILNFLGINYELKGFKAEVHNPFRGKPRGKIAKEILENKFTVKLSKKLILRSGRQFIEHKLLQTKSKPKISKKDKEPLVKFYENDVRKIQDFLGKKLPWKNFKEL